LLRKVISREETDPWDDRSRLRFEVVARNYEPSTVIFLDPGSRKLERSTYDGSGPFAAYIS
jgi:hypothetical protein